MKEKFILNIIISCITYIIISCINFAISIITYPDSNIGLIYHIFPDFNEILILYAGIALSCIVSSMYIFMSTKFVQLNNWYINILSLSVPAIISIILLLVVKYINPAIYGIAIFSNISLGYIINVVFYTPFSYVISLIPTLFMTIGMLLKTKKINVSSSSVKSKS